MTREIDVLGLLLPGLLVCGLLALLLYALLRRALDRLRPAREAWHSALVDVALYVVLLLVVSMATVHAAVGGAP
jgi:hypothetical protein